MHRTDDRDVFVASARVVGPSSFEVAARWPATHAFYGPVTGRHDPLMVLETMREACFVIGHGAYDIPRDTAFIVRHKEFECYPAALYTAGDVPVDVIVRITTTDIRRRGDAVTGLRFNATCFRDGEPAAAVSYQVILASAAVYTRLRGDHREAKPALAVETPPVWPARVGRTDELDVLLTDAPGAPGWYLRVDPTHPVIFDHVVDHVPGNAAVEAVRQAAYLALGRSDATLLRCAISFDRYLEFDAPCLVSAERTGEEAGGRRTVTVTFTQHDQVCAHGTAELLA